MKNRVQGFPYFVLSKEDKNEKYERYLKIDEYIWTLAFVFPEAFAEVFAQSVSPSHVTIGWGKNSQAVTFLKNNVNRKGFQEA